jgi:hypothetical protein
MPKPAIQFTVIDTPTQDLAVTVRGAGSPPGGNQAETREIGTPPLGSADPDDSAGEPPDPVSIFVAAGRLHMFASAAAEPWESTVELSSRASGPATGDVTYRVRLRNVHRGALRVLANLLIARLPELVRMETAKAPGDVLASRLDVTSLEYPLAAGKAPFAVDYEEPARGSRDRSLQIELARPPEHDELETLYSGLATWSQLLLFGGYPYENLDPWQSSAGPDPAFLVDPRTIEQAFPDLFLCDDDCYACVVNWARWLHRAGLPVTQIVLR